MSDGEGDRDKTGATQTADPDLVGVDARPTRDRPPPVDDAVARPTLPLAHVEPTNYELIGEQGRGGIGVVTKVRDLRLDRVVALKELQKPTAVARLRFEREMRITARLQHPGVVPVHECGQWPDGSPFYAMKLVEGRSLKDLILEKKSLAERLILLPHVIAVADTIAYAHSQGVVHRDLKPANVVIGAFGETVVIDWGLAKHVDESEDRAPRSDTSSNDDSVTRAGEVLGTPAYMAPEQARGEMVDERADVFSLGAILFQLLAGTVPRRQDSSTTGTVSPALSAIEPTTPGELMAVVEKAMAASRADRYATAAALALDLRRFQAGQLVSVHRYSRQDLFWRWVRRHRIPVAIAAIAAAAIVVIGAVSLNNILDAKADAERQRQEAEARRIDALRRLDEIVATHARSVLPADPGAALAVLKHFRGWNGDWHAAASVASTAVAGGFTRALIDFRVPAVTTMASDPEGRTLVVVSYDGTILDGIVLDDGRVDLRATTCKLREGRALVHARATGSWVADDDFARQLFLCDVHRSKVTRSTMDKQIVVKRFSEDGRFLAVSLESGGVALLQVPSLQRQRFFPTASTIRYLEFLSGTVAVLGTMHDVWLVDLVTGSGRPVLADHPANLVAVATKLGARPAWLALDSTGCVLDSDRPGRPICVNAPKEIRPGSTAPGQHAVPAALAVSPTGQHAAALLDGDTWLIDLATGATSKLASPGIDQWIRFFPDGSSLLTSDDRGHMHRFVVHARASSMTTANGHTDEVTAAVFVRLRDGWTVLSAGLDKRVRLWALPRHKPEFAIKLSNETLFHVSVPSPGVFVTDASDGMIRAFRPADGSLRVLADHGTLAHGLENVGPLLVSSSLAGVVRVLTVAGELETLCCAVFGLVQVALSHDLRRVAAGGVEGSVWLWELPSGTPRKIAGHDGRIYGLRFTGDHRVVSAGDDGRAWLTDVDSGEQNVVCEIEAGILFLELARRRDGSEVIVCAGRGGELVATSLTDLRPLPGWKMAGPVRSLRSSPSGARVMAGARDGSTAIFDVDRAEWRTFERQDRTVIAIAFVDESIVAIAADDGSVRLWSLEERTTLTLAEDVLPYALAYDPATQLLVSAGWDGRLIGWKIDRDLLAQMPPASPALLEWLDQATTLTIDPEGMTELR